MRTRTLHETDALLVRQTIGGAGRGVATKTFHFKQKGGPGCVKVRVDSPAGGKCHFPDEPSNMITITVQGRDTDTARQELQIYVHSYGDIGVAECTNVKLKERQNDVNLQNHADCASRKSVTDGCSCFVGKARQAGELLSELLKSASQPSAYVYISRTILQQILSDTETTHEALCEELEKLGKIHPDAPENVSRELELILNGMAMLLRTFSEGIREKTALADI